MGPGQLTRADRTRSLLEKWWGTFPTCLLKFRGHHTQLLTAADGSAMVAARLDWQEWLCRACPTI